MISNPNIKHESAIALYSHLKNNSKSVFFSFDNYEAESVKSIEHLTINNSILFNKLNSLDVYMCFDRINWEKGKTFPQYDSEDLSNKCYVITSKHKVYKCLFNLNGTTSKYEPDHETFEPKVYIDGYKWKYLYTLSSREIHNYLSDKYIPINPEPLINSVQYQTEYYSVGGTIDSIEMTNYGSNYTTARIEIEGDGTGAGAVPTIIDGTIMAIKIVNPGKNYTWANIKIIGDGIEADGKPHVSPYFGHGSDLIKELNVNSVIVLSEQIPGSSNDIDIPEEFSYDNVSLISGLNIDNSNKTIVPMTYKLEVESLDGLAANQAIKLNNYECKVISTLTENGTNIVYISSLNKYLSKSDLQNKEILSSTDTVLTAITDVLALPFNIKNSFKILHSEKLDEEQNITGKNLDILRIVINSN